MVGAEDCTEADVIAGIEHHKIYTDGSCFKLLGLFPANWGFSRQTGAFPGRRFHRLRFGGFSLYLFLHFLPGCLPEQQANAWNFQKNLPGKAPTESVAGRERYGRRWCRAGVARSTTCCAGEAQGIAEDALGFAGGDMGVPREALGSFIFVGMGGLISSWDLLHLHFIWYG